MLSRLGLPALLTAPTADAKEPELILDDATPDLYRA